MDLELVVVVQLDQAGGQGCRGPGRIPDAEGEHVRREGGRSEGRREQALGGHHKDAVLAAQRRLEGGTAGGLVLGNPLAALRRHDIGDLNDGTLIPGDGHEGGQPGHDLVGALAVRHDHGEPSGTPGKGAQQSYRHQRLVVQGKADTPTGRDRHAPPDQARKRARQMLPSRLCVGAAIARVCGVRPA